MTDSTAQDTLTAYLQQAAADLARSGGSTDETSEGLLFLGAWHQSYPAILVRDPFLTDSAKIHFLFLMQESCHNPRSAVAMPSLEQTARTLGHAWRTAQRDRTLLRVCRWISQHKRVRDDHGRYCGTINAIHSEPCSLHEANRLDASYLQLLSDVQHHSDRSISEAARATLAGIDQRLQSGCDPLEPADAMTRRLDAAQAAQSGGGSFFDLLMPAGHPVASSDSAAHSAHGDDDPYANFAIESAGHPVASARAPANLAYGRPCANSAYGSENPYANFAHGEFNKKNQSDNETRPPVSKNSTPPTCSSSSTTTTTVTQTRARKADLEHNQTGEAADASALLWPEQLPANERQLIERAFASRSLSSGQQQQVVDAIARKLTDRDHPLRSPVGYAVKLCKRVEEGTFQPVGAPQRAGAAAAARTGPDHALADMRQQMRDLQGEITGLDENLIPFAPHETRPDLEARRDRLIAERDNLKQRCRELKQSSGERSSQAMSR